MTLQIFTGANDSFTISTAGSRELAFLGGDDTLTVNGGTGTIALMGEGDDLVSLRSGPATIYGESGADRFEVYAANVMVDGGGDSDLFNIRGGSGQQLSGEDGDDRFNFYAAAASVILSGGDGNDDFLGYGHTITGNINGDAGDDYFLGFVGGTTLSGGSGDDIYRADAFNPATFSEDSGEGTDSVQVARGISYTLAANIENISVSGFSGSTGNAATLTGNAINNTIIAHNNIDIINGMDGNDRLFGKGADDVLNGGNGNDYLDGGSGNDTLNGNAGNDVINGRAGDDVMSGGTGDDSYYVDSSSDQVIEGVGAGVDLVRSSVPFYQLTENVENGYISGAIGATLYGNSMDNLLVGGSGNDTLYGWEGADTIKGGAGDDFLGGQDGNDVVVGGDGNDFVYGDEGDDLVQGGDGNDTLYGFSGTDVLEGGNGDDTLYGHYDADVMTGGAGNDIFKFFGVSDSVPGAADQITDFEGVFGTSDVLDFTLIDANTAIAGDQAFALSYGGSSAANSLWWTYADSPGGGLDFVFYGDVNGDTIADFEVHVHTVGTIYTDDLLL